MQQMQQMQQGNRAAGQQGSRQGRGCRTGSSAAVVHVSGKPGIQTDAKKKTKRRRGRRRRRRGCWCSGALVLAGAVVSATYSAC